MRIELAGQVHVITGAGRGIGLAIATMIAEAGGIPVLVARSEETIEAAAAALRARGLSAEAFAADIGDEARCTALVKHVVDSQGRLDGIINNAATNTVGNLVMSKEKDWRAVFDINVFALMRLTKLCMRPMIRAKSGRVVNISSVAGKIGAAYTSAYAASKGAVDAFTRSVAREVGKIGITANAVCPWHVDTEHLRAGMGKRAKLFGKTTEEYMAEIAATNPQQRILDPEEVAATVVFLLSNYARGINGQALNVCGGMVMGV
ncbi:MAG: SDR family oxidoreductase [Nannocystaceae bacterium]|nr:SDR family oxidoreductase [Nannocystaceae bacterium]